MQSYNKSTNNKVVPVFITICGIAVFGSAVLGSRAAFSVKVDDSKVVESSKQAVEVDKEVLNKKLNILQMSVDYALDGSREVEASSGNVLQTDTEKLRFAFMVISEQGNSSRIIRNVTADGIEMVGAIAIDKEYFIDYYQELFNAGVNEDLLAQTYSIVDGYIYGNVSYGLVMDHGTYKVNKVYKEGNSYEILIDVLKENADERDDSVTEYEESSVAYQITLNVSEDDAVYTINSMVA